MPTLWLEILIFVFGTCIGSFLNVCIYRLPESKSIVRPGSACPACGTPIRFYDNLPLIGYLILRGRCRQCHSPISIRYPIVELLGGLFALCLFLKFGQSPAALIYFIFVAALLTITFIDLDHRIIPDIITLPGIPIGLAASFLLPQVTVTQSMIGILAGGGSLLAVAWVYQLLTGREGMGGGDIKLLAMIGAFIGWQGVLLTIFAASAIGTLAGILAMLKTGKGMKLAVPFGPFLAIGALIHLFFGEAIISWYLYGALS
jgi:leader peptidase (prepilin peptidase) / N-methyltransferase